MAIIIGRVCGIKRVKEVILGESWREKECNINFEVYTDVLGHRLRLPICKSSSVTQGYQTLICAPVSKLCVYRIICNKVCQV